MKLLFDCTELSYYNENSGHRAGVFYVALNLLRELKNEDITFVCDFKRYYFMKEIEEFKDIPLLEEHSFFNRLMAKILYLTNKCPTRIKYAFIILARFYDKYLYRINKKNLKQLEEFDAYFSPFTPPSKEIQQANLKRFRMIHDVIPILENSECTRKDVLKYFPFIQKNHIKTTLLGANSEFYPVKTKNNEKYIFSLCTLGKRKNLIFGIKNFFEFIEKHKIEDLKLVLGGGVWKKFEGELNTILDKYDPTKVVLTGYIQENELRNYFSNALCFIYPSLYEGFGLPVLEAMQCGCPVITSNKSSLPEVIGECGIQINPLKDEEMIEALEKMYFNESFRDKCSENGLERAKTFSWEKCASELMEFIKTNCI